MFWDDAPSPVQTGCASAATVDSGGEIIDDVPPLTVQSPDTTAESS